jgi:hypothetical protein
MVFAAQDRAVSEAHPDIADSNGTGRVGRSQTRLHDPAGPSAEAADGGPDRRLYGPCGPGNRSGCGRGGRSPEPHSTDASTAFLQAVRARFSEIVNFAHFALEEIRSRRWASVTFQGARHELAFSLEGAGAEEAAERFLDGLEPRSFGLRGHLVADITIVAQERRPGFARIRLDALTVEEK